MRRANGQGSVYKLSGKRHKPWCARLTTGWNDKGQPKYKYIGYFKTKTEAQNALARYSVAPYEVRKITFKDAWAQWCLAYTGAQETIKSYRSAYNRMQDVYDVTLDQLNMEHFQSLCDQPPVTYARANNVKKVFSAVLDWGFAHDYCPASRKELLDYVKLPPRPSNKETRSEPWTNEEIQMAFDRHWIGAIILIFTGLRFGELLNLTEETIHLDERYIEILDAKSQAGIRWVPIPKGLVPYLQEYIAKKGLYRSKTYFNSHFWHDKTISHTHHDCRHTYVTALQKAKVDEREVKAMTGHKGDVTLDVYTHFTVPDMCAVVDEVFAKWFPLVQTDDEGSARLLA